MLAPVDYGIYDGMNYGPFLDLNNWKSTQVTVNILNFSAFNRRRNFGISAAIGIRANNFRLDKSLTLADEGPMITPSTLGGDLQVKKSKFTVAALSHPRRNIVRTLGQVLGIGGRFRRHSDELAYQDQV